MKRMPWFLRWCLAGSRCFCEFRDMKRFLLHGVISLGLLATAPARTWTSSDGRTLEGDFVRVEGEVAVLKVKGKMIRVPFSKLSEKDVAFLKEGAQKAKAGTNRLFGIELKPGMVDTDEFLDDSMKKLIWTQDFTPSKVVVRLWIPEGFDPTKPQKVLWLVGSQDNDAERRRGNKNMFLRGQAPMEKGWIVITADTNQGNPRRSATKVSEADAEFHYFVIDELVKAWPEFRNWKHACVGHSSGAQVTFFRLAQLMRAQVNVVGGFFSCCSKGMVRLASQEAKVRSGDWRKIKAFQSTGDKDLLVKPSQIKSVSEDLKRGGVKKVVSKTFPGTHNFHEEYLMEALEWFEKEEEE